MAPGAAVRRGVLSGLLDRWVIVFTDRWQGCGQASAVGGGDVLNTEAVVFGPDGSLAAVPELRLSFTLPDKDVGPIEADLVDRGGYWSANTVTLPLPGTWTMRATVRVSEIDQVSETRRIRVER